MHRLQINLFEKLDHGQNAARNCGNTAHLRLAACTTHVRTRQPQSHVGHVVQTALIGKFGPKINFVAWATIFLETSIFEQLQPSVYVAILPSNLMSRCFDPAWAKNLQTVCERVSIFLTSPRTDWKKVCTHMIHGYFIIRLLSRGILHHKTRVQINTRNTRQ